MSEKYCSHGELAANCVFCKDEDERSGRFRNRIATLEARAARWKLAAKTAQEERCFNTTSCVNDDYVQRYKDGRIALEAENARYREALVGLKNEEGCWCNLNQWDPRTFHDPKCTAARNAMEETDG